MYEAEAGALSGGAAIGDASNASGGRVVGDLNNLGAAVQVSVAAGTGGSASLVVRFSNGYSNTRSLSLYLNGVRQQQLVFGPTGGWNTFANTASIALTLAPGTNTLRIQRDAADVFAADIDRFAVTLNY
jgi:hypothetical protein